ncbi:hypothetical protein GUJ93_ZPchr0002g26479 [Zizania palustris]|uniref:F-box domain-containing protein n=1 Tax=Zizania palustris TaxID=103762 RepID=A0A8J5RU83_ZIZPA|nr:hypothetical protein GUJ93_ZPchr0002g26479 [Zizania palustris]
MADQSETSSPWSCKRPLRSSMADQSETSSPLSCKRPRYGNATLPDKLVIEHILTRVPPAAVVGLRAVCRTWRAALTSDRFVRAHRDRRRAATGDSQTEIIFFAPAAMGNAAAFYACKLAPDGSGVARELVSVHNLMELINV